jgi:hypothetical protein
MNINLSYLQEPELQFGGYFQHQDGKTGLAEYGPFGKNIEGLHPSEIKLGFIGTRETISGAQEWIAECGEVIHSQVAAPPPAQSRKPRRKETAVFGMEPLFEIIAAGVEPEDEKPELLKRYRKILNPDFVGFNKDSPFSCAFQSNERWVRIIQPREIEKILAREDKEQRILELVQFFDHHIESLSKASPAPDVIILALTKEIVEKAANVRISGNFFLDFRRAIKARAMKWGIPTQIAKRTTVLGTGKKLQDKATRAWNFSTAQYYKAQGVPWRPLGLEPDTCYVGINFYTVSDSGGSVTVRSSLAQAFDYMGQGLVLMGDPFKWDRDKHGKSPHLEKDAARKLISGALRAYEDFRGTPPRRVVIHKTSEYWGVEHGEYNELDGLYEGVDEVYRGCETDFVALGQTHVRLFREGDYPPLRGTYFSIGEGDSAKHFLYTMGYTPYLQTYPGSYVPEPWQITSHHGGSSPKELFREILALTKMNVNNCSFADGAPITLSFSDEVGDIMKHLPEGADARPDYRFYM